MDEIADDFVECTLNLEDYLDCFRVFLVLLEEVVNVLVCFKLEINSILCARLQVVRLNRRAHKDSSQCFICFLVASHLSQLSAQLRILSLDCSLNN